MPKYMLKIVLCGFWSIKLWYFHVSNGVMCCTTGLLPLCQVLLLFWSIKPKRGLKEYIPATSTFCMNVVSINKINIENDAFFFFTCDTGGDLNYDDDDDDEGRAGDDDK